jgi:protein phosphatase 1 regulatory subunit 3A/B/C/D/E
MTPDTQQAVTVRWTINDWSTFTDLAAVYVPGSSDGFSDKFSFRLVVGTLPVGSRIQFCLRYNSSGAEFWDSNNGANYVFQVGHVFHGFRIPPSRAKNKVNPHATHTHKTRSIFSGL